eukprot:m.33856 g.33856  ORF g.33856 m.33856 type:complete len:58 (+) comp12261_c0_seq4:581-754(+)
MYAVVRFDLAWTMALLSVAYETIPELHQAQGLEDPHHQRPQIVFSPELQKTVQDQDP